MCCRTDVARKWDEGQVRFLLPCQPRCTLSSAQRTFYWHDWEGGERSLCGLAVGGGARASERVSFMGPGELDLGFLLPPSLPFLAYTRVRLKGMDQLRSAICSGEGRICFLMGLDLIGEDSFYFLCEGSSPLLTSTGLREVASVKVARAISCARQIWRVTSPGDPSVGLRGQAGVGCGEARP